MLSDVRDLARLRDGVRRMIAITKRPEMTAVIERATALSLDPELRKAPEEFESDAEIDRWLLGSAADAQHIVGTCRMGRPGDARSVVDPQCRVLGTEGLRVIDASIMPSVPRANTHLTCVMIGELMADRLCAR